MFMNSNQKIRKLIPNATPIKFGVNNSENPIKCSPKCENTQNADFNTPVKRTKPAEIKGCVLDFNTYPSDSKSLFSLSPEVLKVLTPENKYQSVMANSFNLQRRRNIDV